MPGPEDGPVAWPLARTPRADRDEEALVDAARTVVAADTVFLLREHGEGGDEGVPLLLLHGVPETSSCWRDVAGQLAPGRRVLAPDLPGLGGSTYGGPYDVPALVAQLVALLDAEGLEQVDLAGHDWGGVLGLALAGLHPGRVRRLAVLNAPYRKAPPVSRAVHLPLLALPVLPEIAFWLSGRRLVDLALRVGWKAPHALDAARRAEYQAAYGGAGRAGAMLGYYRAAVRPRVLGRAAPVPPALVDAALVLWGALDPVLPIATGEAAVRDLGPSTRLTTVPGAGHFVVEEAPEVVSEVLSAFFR